MDINANNIAPAKEEKEIERNVKLQKSQDSIWWKTIRLVLNFLTNVLIALAVFVCMLYSCTSWKLSLYEMHIVFCVLGYQFFMNQGTLVLSRYNSWSVYLNKRYRVHLHWILQVIGIVFAVVGSSMMIYAKPVNFDTAHGIVGLVALITSLLSFINGILTHRAHKLSSYFNLRWINFSHYFTGISTMLLSAVCLCLGFDKIFFRSWAGPNNTMLLIILTPIFTLLVAMDFWIAMKNKIRNIM